MTESAPKALLPTGLRDALPEEAERESRAVHTLLATFALFGYAQVKPPLLEFENSLLAGPGAGLSSQLFRLMDPISQAMMGLRADITPQIARIAATRLRSAPRPLRVSYAGQVARVKGDQLRPERQFTQVGAEMLGSDTVRADAEIVAMTAAALAETGIPELSIDLTVPRLAELVIAGQGYNGTDADEIRAALDGKDAGRLQELVGDDAILSGLLNAAGTADLAIQRLQELGLAGDAGQMINRLAETVTAIRQEVPDLALTIDPAEYRGFEYQSGVAFAIFARNVRGELGRGGRYTTETGETSVGVSLYMDSILRALDDKEAPARIFAPLDVPSDVVATARRGGKVVCRALDAAENADAEARRQGCSDILMPDGTVRSLQD